MIFNRSEIKRDYKVLNSSEQDVSEQTKDRIIEILHKTLLSLEG